MAAHAREEAEARLGPDDPCLMVGYSASATVAYEAAQQMHAAGRRVHLLLLDGSPARRAGQWNEVIDRFEEPYRSKEVTIREASRSELPAAVMRSLAYRWHAVRRLRFERYPGRPRFDRDRYRGFRRILGKASRAYEPARAAFPTTLIHVGDEDVVARTKLFISDLSVKVVGGDHVTMLELPEVANLAAEVAAWSDRALAEASPVAP
jgi:thioesterase domain-containing protein